MKLPPKVEAVIARLVEECGFTDPRTAGTPTVELVWRSLKLQRDVYEHFAARRRALANARELVSEIPALAGKAADAVEALEVEVLRLDLAAALADELEQIDLDPRSRRRAA